MFVLCTPAQSDAMLQELCDLEEHLFSQLGLHFRMMVPPPQGIGSWIAAWLSHTPPRALHT
jgi:seryl-tRNA synthetase